MNAIRAAVSALDSGPLQEESLRRHIDPLFSRVLRESGDRIYLANHSLGRPLDQTEEDVAEGLSHWYRDRDDAWEYWGKEMMYFRAQIASVIHAAGPHCIAPKSNAGQGLRAVLNRYDKPIRVISTRDEFSSIDHILKAYGARGRIVIEWVEPQDGTRYDIEDFQRALRNGADIIVTSMTFFTTGQCLSDFNALAATARSRNVLLVADLYHVTGAMPVNVTELGVDFAIGGCYKYLRGGPGAGWLYIHPRWLNEPPRTLDTGWFATSDPFGFVRREHPSYAPGADGWLESTPAILPYYQARSGLEFTLAVGAERLRDYSLRQQRLLTERLAHWGIYPIIEERSRGAFIAIRMADAAAFATVLKRRGVVIDARADLLRICPDILNTSAELANAADAIAAAARGS